MTKMYSADAILKVNYTVSADDMDQAKEFIAELIQEDYPDTDLDTIVNWEEVK